MKRRLNTVSDFFFLYILDYTGSIGSFELQIVLGAEGEGTSMVWIILVLLPYLNYNEL
jgi:hypothetical protein